MSENARAESDGSFLKAHLVSKTYRTGAKQVLALSEISFELGEGEIVGLSGPSGSGKSTLLNILGGLDRPTSGTVLVDGVPLHELSDDALTLYRRQTVGFVFQASYLVPSLTVQENVMLPLLPAPLSPEEKEARVTAALEQVNITHRASHLPGELSGGEQQRAAVARAIVNQPRLILADEPTGELDAANAARIVELLSGFAGEGRTVVIASHDPDVIAVTDRVIQLQAGTVVSTS
ncbi:MAG: ABC transporter ATP-binding protein [Armatimonadetes bacterium]|nr:ABC transporter ATP-binding protein [Armatimonadota bacterium]